MLRNTTMYRGVAASRTHAETLPLFVWANAQRDSHQPVNLPRAARLVASRFGLPIARARIIAELAGFPMEAA